MPDVPERCPMCGAPERRQLLVGNYLASNAIEYECETMVIEGGETSESTNCLRRQRDAARAEAERLKTENERLHRRIEGLEAKIARQRAVISRLQAAIERRNSEERIEAMRRALHDETLERYMREYDAAGDEAERWRQQHEALRAGVERVADDLRIAAEEAHENWRITADFNEQGRAIGLEGAEWMVRRVLTEAGGGSQ